MSRSPPQAPKKLSKQVVLLTIVQPSATFVLEWAVANGRVGGLLHFLRRFKEWEELPPQKRALYHFSDPDGCMLELNERWASVPLESFGNNVFAVRFDSDGDRLQWTLATYAVEVEELEPCAIDCCYALDRLLREINA